MSSIYQKMSVKYCDMGLVNRKKIDKNNGSHEVPLEKLKIRSRHLQLQNRSLVEQHHCQHQECLPNGKNSIKKMSRIARLKIVKIISVII